MEKIEPPVKSENPKERKPDIYQRSQLKAGNRMSVNSVMGGRFFETMTDASLNKSRGSGAQRSVCLGGVGVGPLQIELAGRLDCGNSRSLSRPGSGLGGVGRESEPKIHKSRLSTGNFNLGLTNCKK
jgi:hypothetical protein